MLCYNLKLPSRQFNVTLFPNGSSYFPPLLLHEILLISTKTFAQQETSLCVLITFIIIIFNSTESICFKNVYSLSFKGLSFLYCFAHICF